MNDQKVIKKSKIPMNIQFFAEGDGEGAEGADAGAGEGQVNDGGAGAADKPKSFDELLSDKEYQSEFDRRVQKAVSTAVTNAQQKWQALTDDKLSEADKLAKMNKEEKAEYLQHKREKELSDKEAAITKRELMAEAKNTLTEKKLPLGLAEVLNYTDAGSCSKSIDAIEKAFQEAVEVAVQGRLKGGVPPTAAKQTGTLEDEVAKAIRGNY